MDRSSNSIRSIGTWGHGVKNQYEGAPVDAKGAL